MLTRAETRALAAVATELAGQETPCSGCGRAMGAEERFCAGCGTLRQGLDPNRVVRGGSGESRTEAAWREVQEQLALATAGRFDVIRELGRGGMAAVYLAEEVRLRRPVAIKVMRPSFLLDEGMVERFAREARTMASLHHPNIVMVHAVEESGDLHFFVMQYIAGRSLDQVLRDAGPLPVAAVQALLFQAGAGLGHAHRQGVVHRDVKPANIMLDQDGNAIVTDFGIAKVSDVQATSMTVGPMGTPLYMSPEQCSGITITPASDQYSLGNVAYEMLTGQTPFRGETAIALGAAIIGEKPKPVRALRPDCPPDVEAAVLRMLAKDPEDRFPNLATAVAAMGGAPLAEDDPVREYLSQLAKKESKPDGRHLTPRASRGSGSFGQGKSVGWLRDRRRQAAVGIVAGVLVIGSIAFLALRPKPAESDRSGRGSGGPLASTPGPSTPAAAAPGPAPNPQPPPAPTAVSDRSVEVAPLLATARRAADRRDWVSATQALERIAALDPANADARGLRARVEAERRKDVVGSLPAATPAPAPAPAPAAPPPAAPAAATPVDSARPAESRKPHHEGEIRQAIDAYVQAINGRSLGALKAIYPGISPKQESDWGDRFGKDVKRLAATVAVRSIEETTDGNADATFELDLRLEPKDGGPLDFKIQSLARLVRQNGAWRITNLTERGK